MLEKFPSVSQADDAVQIQVFPEKKRQQISGFGGAITQSTAHLLQQLSEVKRREVLEAYFGTDGANYSMIRLHINSCDFSTHQYAYAMDSSDIHLNTFDISRDTMDIIPIVNQAQRISQDGFKIIASPWTAPPWMKDNRNWVGGKLLENYYPSWALYFAKYLEAYQDYGIDIWGLTVENEPLGNGNNWESMHFTPMEMNAFVEGYLGTTLEKHHLGHIKILGYDQNRADLREWVDTMYDEQVGSKYYDGTAIHWYESTFEVFPEALDYAHNKAPDKHLIQTEACIDAEVPKWNEDEWYWLPEATDWGWDWAPEDKKYLHPKYKPVHRYARDIIGCLNHHVDVWVYLNMVLDKQG